MTAIRKISLQYAYIQQHTIETTEIRRSNDRFGFNPYYHSKCRMNQKKVDGTQILIPDVPNRKDSYYTRSKKHKLFCKRAGIEPTIGHLKSDFRLGRNFYKGVFGDTVNLLLAAAAYNFKRAMRVLLWLIEKICGILFPYNIPQMGAF